MIPILYDKTETAFDRNGIGRLRDCISCIVTEERNGIYECDFEYPMDGANYELIQIGRIIGVTHDDGGDIQPFDIVSFTKPIDGVVTFHCTHISYRQSYITVKGTNINSLSSAFTLLESAEPSNPFHYVTDKDSTGYLGCMDGIPRTVRQTLGGIEGSILDAYGGEYEWDRWTVKLHSARGQYRDFTIRYGVNMLDYNEDYDSTNCYSSCIPYWTDGGENIVVGDMQTYGGVTPSGRDLCIPLDVSASFESKPTKAQVQAEGLAKMNDQQPTNPTRNIKVSFVRLQDLGEFADFQNLLQCKLCDTIKVIFPDFASQANFKIVKTIWNVLTGKYDEMELGDLSTSLSEALGISVTLDKQGSSGGGGGGGGGYTYGTTSGWTWKKWDDGLIEAWHTEDFSATTATSWGQVYYHDDAVSIPSGIFTSTPQITVTAYQNNNNLKPQWWVGGISDVSSTGFTLRRFKPNSNSQAGKAFIYAVQV